jgi:hypothetical protein
VGSRTLGAVVALLIVLGAWAAAAGARFTGAASAGRRFGSFPPLHGIVSSRAPGLRPRIGGAMGIIAPLGRQEIAVGENIPVLYHGGSVMRGVTVHTIFWAPAGHQFDGGPAGSRSYVQLIQQFFTDLAHDSGTSGNALGVLDEYGDGAGKGLYSISYNAATDSIDATDPYPSRDQQCASPSGVATCITDLELQTEIDHIITTHAPSARGLHDLWFMFLPPDVDTCSSPGVCGTDTFAGYHGLSNVGHGPVVYAVAVDPLIEGVIGSGGDPEGNPEAETTIDTAAHETAEAITDPEGVGWMDPNGLEVGDKCENGPQSGALLGFAPDGSPYNQLINGHEYLIQALWSNAAGGCVQHASSGPPPAPIATVRMRQFSSVVSGNIGSARRGVGVTVVLARAGIPVALGNARTGSDGGWAASLLAIAAPGVLAVGDDRDEILVAYGPGGPDPDLIETGDGGDPFTDSGWTGWFDLDTGYEIASRGVALGPCSQTGVLALRIGPALTAPPVEQCETETDAAVVLTPRIGPGTSVTMSSEDNRAVSADNPAGALVKLTVSLGEPDSAGAIGNPNVLFEPSGFPSCTADLQAQTVGCDGLVPGTRYALTRRRGDVVRRASADVDGAIKVAIRIRGGDRLTLTNAARRSLTTLHVAHLRVDIVGHQTAIASGQCQPGDYYGPRLTRLPASASVDQPGAGGTGVICPLDGDATGLSSASIQQTDDMSGGQTRTEVPDVNVFSPSSGGTLYGPFIAFGRPSLPGPNGSLLPARATVALTVTPAGARRPVLRLANVALTGGVTVPALAPGVYDASWVLSDSNGDTRTIRSTFAEAG